MSALELSCGIIIITETNKVLLGHSTGNKFWDIPKGRQDEGETFLETALRELREETGLCNCDPLFLKQIGKIDYIKDKKDLFLYKWEVLETSLDLASMICTSTFTNKWGKVVPEFDDFKLVEISELNKFCTKNMSKVLETLLTASKT